MNRDGWGVSGTARTTRAVTVQCSVPCRVFVRMRREQVIERVSVHMEWAFHYHVQLIRLSNVDDLEVLAPVPSENSLELVHVHATHLSGLVTAAGGHAHCACERSRRSHPSDGEGSCRQHRHRKRSSRESRAHACCVEAVQGRHEGEYTDDRR